MKCRKNFSKLPDNVSSTHVSDVSMTQPDMSLTIQQIMERFAFVGDTPVGFLPSYYENPDIDLKEDNKLLSSLDVEQLDIAELEELSIKFQQKADYLRSLPPAPASTPAPEGGDPAPDTKADAPKA